MLGRRGLAPAAERRNGNRGGGLGTDLTGQVAIVTGGAGLVGSAICRRFVAAGATVAIIDRDSQRLDVLASELGEQAAGYAGDVLDESWLQATIEEIARSRGRIDILVNGVGGSRSGQIGRLDTANWDFVINLNLKSAFLCTRAVLPHMTKRGYGRIISFGSGANHGTIGLGNYAAAKAGLVGLAQTVTLEAAPSGITANVLILGLVESERVASRRGPLVEQLIAQMPAGRLVRPEEVAGTALFLCSPDAGCITGEAIHLTGGMAWTGPSVVVSAS